MTEQSFAISVSEEPGKALADMLVYVCAMALVVVGIVGAVVKQDLRSLSLVVVGIGLYTYLVFAPGRKSRVVQYLTIGELGIKYIHASAGHDRVSWYAWSEIEQVEFRDDEVCALCLFTNRLGFSGVPISLEIRRSDGLVASQAAQQWLEAVQAKSCGA